MVAMITTGEVGAVFAGDDSRLSRAAIVTLGLLDQCMAKHVLLIRDHKVPDLADPTARAHPYVQAAIKTPQTRRSRNFETGGRPRRAGPVIMAG